MTLFWRYNAIVIYYVMCPVGMPWDISRKEENVSNHNYKAMCFKKLELLPVSWSYEDNTTAVDGLATEIPMASAAMVLN